MGSPGTNPVARLGSTVALIVALMVALLAACSGPGRGQDASQPVTVRVIMSHDPASLSLLGKPDRNSGILAVQLTDSLVQFNENLEFTPRVAESWQFSDDHSVLTFKIRPGVRWHDGRPVTAHDVVFSYELALDPLVENREVGPLLEDISEVRALDDMTVQATYEHPTPDALEPWRMPLLPRHRAERGVELLTGEFARHPIGCGPFKFVRHRPGEEIVLEANDDYWDGRPGYDRLLFKIWSEHRTAYQALLAGEIDLLVVTPELWHQATHSEHADRLESFSYRRNSVWQVGWNMDGSNPFFLDARVRRALMHALDRESFVENVMHGQGLVAATSFHPDMPWTDPAVRPLSYDPDESRRLLDEAGWVDRDGDGIRDRDGIAFRFTLNIIGSTQRINDDLAAWQQESWARVGVAVEIRKLEWTQFRERRNKHQYQAAMYGLSFSPDPNQYEVYHSTARADGVNYGGFADAEVDRLLETVRSTFDPQARERAVHRLQRRLLELQPNGWLVHFATPVLHDQRLKGIRTTRFDHWRTSAGPRLWYFDEGSGG